MSTTNIGNPEQGRRLKGGNSGQKPIEIKASIGDGSTAGSATPLLKFVGTTANTSDGDHNLSLSTSTYDNIGSPNVALLVEVEANQTSGLLVVGKVYQIVTLLGSDVFTNVHSGSSDEVGLVFTATGTTPTTWTGGSQLANTQQYWMRLYAMGT
jgi:hypothetical protein